VRVRDLNCSTIRIGRLSRYSYEDLETGHVDVLNPISDLLPQRFGNLSPGWFIALGQGREELVESYPGIGEFVHQICDHVGVVIHQALIPVSRREICSILDKTEEKVPLTVPSLAAARSLATIYSFSPESSGHTPLSVSTE
jgi:hypothetical protein